MESGLPQLADHAPGAISNLRRQVDFSLFSIDVEDWFMGFRLRSQQVQSVEQLKMEKVQTAYVDAAPTVKKADARFVESLNSLSSSLSRFYRKQGSQAGWDI